MFEGKTCSLGRSFTMWTRGIPELRLSSSLGFPSLHSNGISNNNERKGMCGPKRFLVAPRRNGHRWRLVCCPSYRHMTMLRWSNTVTSGNRLTVSA